MAVHKKELTPDPPAQGARIRQARLALGLTGTEFGDRIRVKKGTISAWETGERNPDGPSILALKFVYKLNPDWINWGILPMWLEPEALMGELRTAAEVPFVDTFLERPLIIGAAGCGPGGEIQDPGPAAPRYALRRDFVKRILDKCGGGEEGDLFFLLCEGESMRPTILHKEIVLINTALEGRLNPRNNAIYLVRRSAESGDDRVKRVRLDRDRHQLVLSSDNRAFAPAILDLDDIPLHRIILGRVCWVGRYLLDTDPPEGDW
ncbi:LexA family transcriptional regulator [Geothrix sp. 21YS21S-4]|uniref:LexA family transcriptional regulator n=1 Tax=Geothrix sp. 21YS21S-4 TaxID=3068889 RepID=UPI0027BA74B6|nr:LexA family transcriptional regulator [Geothrix sp. 21YS21S-4]